MTKRILVVGAGFYGATCARLLADDGHDVLVLENKDHVGGHCHTEFNMQAGCYQHVYGPHIFHTNNERVWDFVKGFADFNNFVNRPKVNYKGQIYSFPINLMTLYQVFGVRSPTEARERLEFETSRFSDPMLSHTDNMEQWCLGTIGRTLYETFIEGYTEKQWGRHPRELPASIIKRIPIRFDFNDNYFDHVHQGIPKAGYTQLIDDMLDNHGVAIELGVDFLAERDTWIESYDLVIYTGAIDEFFGYALGELEYRTLRFETETIRTPDYQGNAVINYTAPEIPHTRIVEHRHFNPTIGQNCPYTLITREYPAEWQRGMDAYYPVHSEQSISRLKQYQDYAARYHGNVVFGGRLGSFKYADMDQTIADAMAKVDELRKAWR